MSAEQSHHEALCVADLPVWQNSHLNALGAGRQENVTQTGPDQEQLFFSANFPKWTGLRVEAALKSVAIQWLNKEGISRMTMGTNG